jgi:hypothetical protein
MCNCQVCQDTRHFRTELKQLPAEHQSIFEGLYDNLLHVEMDRDYYHAILEGSWPSAQEILARFHGQPHNEERLTLAMTALPGFEEVVAQLPESAQPYFKSLGERMLKTDAELVHMKNIVLNAIADSNQLLAQFRATRTTVVTQH